MKKLIQGVSGAGLKCSLGDSRRIVVGSVVSVVVDSACSARMRATCGKSLFTETLYVAQIIRYVIVYGIASEPIRYLN